MRNGLITPNAIAGRKVDACATELFEVIIQ